MIRGPFDRVEDHHAARNAYRTLSTSATARGESIMNVNSDEICKSKNNERSIWTNGRMTEPTKARQKPRCSLMIARSANASKKGNRYVQMAKW